MSMDQDLFLEAVLSMVFESGASGMNWKPEDGVEVIGNITYITKEDGIEKTTIIPYAPSERHFLREESASHIAI